MPRQQYAANFYSKASEAWIEKALKDFEPPKLDAPPVAGLVPHAGWEFSGAVAAKVFRTIRSHREPETFVLFGTVHRSIPDNAVYSRGSWLTPFGEVRIDEDLADQIIEQAGGFLERDESAHEHEHSIEVQMPFLKHFFPRAKALPVSVLPDKRAPDVGRRVAEFLKQSGSDAIIVGTTDLTHYGDAYWFTPAGHGRAALDWMKRNDARIIELATELKAEKIVPEAAKNQNACGAGAIAATVAAARALGCASGRTIEYTTSYDVMPEREFRMAVGYVGMIFCGS
jgi:AmmeMemoRadiSam system protein B